MTERKQRTWEWLLPILLSTAISGIIYAGIFYGGTQEAKANQNKINEELKMELKEKVDRDEFIDMRDDIKYIRVRVDQHIADDVNSKKSVSK